MAKLLRLRRGTDTQHTTFTGAEGEVTVNTTNDSLHVHDGVTAGGTELAKADLSNVDGTLSNNLRFGDNIRATFGAGDDLKLYHDSSNSYIEDAGTGSLIVRATNLQINNAGNTQNYISATDGGSAVFYHAGNAKLSTESTGINVTGSVTCDGLTSDGAITVESATGQINIKDYNNANSSAQCELNFTDSNNASLGYLGYAVTSDSDFYIANSLSGSIQFNTNGQNRFEINNSGHVLPNTSGALDLGSSTNQWRNGWFDGTVNCDGLQCDGDLSIRSGYGTLLLRDTSNSGTGAQTRVVFEDSNGNTQSNVGHLANNNNDLYVSNESSANLIFRTAGATRCYVDSTGNFNPGTSNTYDLGTSSVRWRNIYTNDLNLSNEGGANDVDGTWGNWTIQEGEDDLFLLNRRNGKKYKFNLSEVN